MRGKSVFSRFLLVSLLVFCFSACAWGIEQERIWGETVNGLRASISLNRTDYKVGDEFVVELAFQNVSDKPCYFYFSEAHHVCHFLITNDKGEVAKAIVTVKYKLGSPEKNFRLIPPKEELKFKAEARVVISRGDNINPPPSDKVVVISFFDVDQVILNPGRFSIVYQYKTGEFVSNLSRKLELENAWLGALSSNIQKFTVRLSTQKEIDSYIDPLKNGSREEKVEAIEFLRANLELKSSPYLIEILKNGDYELQQLVERTLIAFGDKSIIPQLMNLYEEQKKTNETDNLQRLLNIIFILEKDSAKKREFLKEIINSETSISLKQNAVSYLETLCLQGKDSNDFAYLLEIADSNEPKIRGSVAGALATVYGVFPQDIQERIIDRLTDFSQNDPAPSVRSRAIGALSSIGLFADTGLRSALFPLFLRAMKDSDTDVRRAAVESVGHFGDSSIVPVLEAFIKQTDDKWEIEAAQKAIGQIASRGSLEPAKNKR